VQAGLVLVSLLAGLVGQSGLEDGVRLKEYRRSVVLGVASAPAKVLVAKQRSENTLVLEVLDHRDALLERREVVLPWTQAEKSPGKIPEASALMKAHKLSSPVTGDVAPGNLAMLSTRYDNDKKRVILITGKTRKEMGAFSAEEALVVKPAWTSDGSWLVLSGSTGKVGFLTMEKLPKGAQELSVTERLDVFLGDCEHFAAMGRFQRAASLAESALKVQGTPRVRYLLVMAHAHLQNWKTAVDHLRELEKLKSPEARQFSESLGKLPVVREARLRQMDFNSSRDYTFHASKGFEGTSIWVKIKDREGNSIAVFKPTNGNTYHRGEIFVYQMAKLLDISELYPVNLLYELNRDGCAKFVKSLEEVEYKGVKEKNRQAMLKACRSGRLEGTVKEWVRDFQFFGAIGKGEKLKKHGIYSKLTRGGPWPARDNTVTARQSTKMYKPDRCKSAMYIGRLNEWQMARDLSDIMVMDVLASNEDRFPGANIEFKSLAGVKETSDCVFDLGASRLFSLDNGATFKGTQSNGWADFSKRVQISRFRKETFRRLTQIREFIENKRTAPVFLRRWGITRPSELWAFLALDKGDKHPRRKEPHKLFLTNLNNALTYMNRFANDKFAWYD
jgi:hypothetical protein